MIFSTTGIWSAPDPLVISFDKATGQLSNPVLLPDFGAEPEFSPNSRYLYGFKEISTSATSYRYRIIRFDLQNLSNIPIPDIIDSLSFSGFTFTHPQLAPDGNIYIMTSNSSNLYHRIDRISCPNTQQASLDTGVFAYTTNVNDFLHYLPNFPPHLFENDDDAFVTLGPDTVRICDLGSSFVLNAQNPGASYLWSTGDTVQSITITAPGTYSVSVNGFCGSGSDQMVVLPCCTAASLPTQTQNISSCGPYTGGSGITYTQSGVYTDTVSFPLACDSVFILNLSINAISAQQDVFSCGPFTSPDGMVYNQNTSFNATFNAANGCDSVVTYNLTILPEPIVDAGAATISITEGDSVQLNASGAVNYVWSPSDGLSCGNCSSPLAFPFLESTYTVTGTDASGCTASDNIRISVDIKCNELFLPDIFTPNGTGPAANEKLCLYGNCIQLYSLVIYNRWGEQVFDSSDMNNCWDGTYKGSPAQSGIYVYRLYAELRNGEVIDKKGSIHLLR
jgi:gliding motility-associated-like protein